MTDLIIVGAGLTGLYAAALAARRGAKVILVTFGRGGLEFSHGCIDVAGSVAARQALRRPRRGHPYARGGRSALENALDAFRQITLEGGIPYAGTPSEVLRLPTALGTLHATCMAPLSMTAGEASLGGDVTIAGLAPFRDFYSGLVADGLSEAGLAATQVPELPIPEAPQRRDAYATDLARLFDDPLEREQLARAWKPRLTGVQRLGLPAVIGFDDSAKAHKDLEERLGVRLFEIPTLPPSVPGIRLERLLRRAALARSASLIEGSMAIGRVDGRSGGRRVSGVVAQTAGGPRLYEAGAVLLATGGILHGGLVTRQDGRVQESVFDLPVVADLDRTRWTAASPFEQQPYAGFGVAVDDDLKPVGPDGAPIFENLFAAGGILAGCDRASEGSRQGIDLATAYRAVEVALG
jgi:glycerol-3-phosphate dehydrogenase subunit B